MSFFVTCKHCGLRLEGAERLVGKVGICPGCKHAVVVERPSEDTAPQIIPMEIQEPPQDEPQTPQETTQHQPQGTTAQPEGTTMPPRGRRFCSNCGAELENKTNFCPKCGKSINNQGSNNPNIREKVCDTVNKGLLSNALGIENLQGFSLGALFKDIFKKHSEEDIYDIIACGTPKTTPNITDIDTSWPRPWLFFRLLAYSIALYWGLVNIIYFFAVKGVSDGNQYSPEMMVTQYSPAMTVIGSFGIPIATLIFFMEANVRRNISISYIIKYLFLGGCLSLAITTFLYNQIDTEHLPKSLKIVVPGLTEETAKLLALFPLLFNKRFRYKLNGLLFGAVVGAGFEVFESIAYNISTLYNTPFELVPRVIFFRGLTSIGAHIVWSAIAACALWRVLGKDDFKLSAFFDWHFLRLFLCPVILHCLWNTEYQLPYFGKYIIIGLVGWIVVLALVQEGLKELREEKKKAENTQKMSDAEKNPDSALQS